MDLRVLSLLPLSRFGDSSTEVKIVLIHSARVLLALLYKVAVPECSQTKKNYNYKLYCWHGFSFHYICKGSTVHRRWRNFRNLQKVVMTPHYQAKFGVSMAEIQLQ